MGSLDGQAHIPLPANLPWCGVTCREVTVWWCGWGWRWWGVISRVLQGPRGHGSRTASEWVFLNGLSSFTLLLKDQFKSSSAVLLPTTPDPNHRSCLWVSCVGKPRSKVAQARCMWAVNMAVCLQGCLSLYVALTQAGSRWDPFGSALAGCGERRKQEEGRDGYRAASFLSQKWEPADQRWGSQGAHQMLSWLLLASVSEAVRSRRGVLRLCGIRDRLVLWIWTYRASLEHILSMAGKTPLS